MEAMEAWSWIDMWHDLDEEAFGWTVSDEQDDDAGHRGVLTWKIIKPEAVPARRLAHEKKKDKKIQRLEAASERQKLAIQSIDAGQKLCSIRAVKLQPQQPASSSSTAPAAVLVPKQEIAEAAEASPMDEDVAEPAGPSDGELWSSCYGPCRGCRNL